MKNLMFTLLLAATASLSAAEYKLPSGRTYKPEPADFRVVDGKVHNIVLSTNWVKIPHADYRISVHNVIKDGVFFRVEHKGTPYGGRSPDTFIFVKNYPDRDKLTTDQSVDRMVVMPTGVRPSKTKDGGEYTMKAYEYGLPNTPENRKVVNAVVNK